MEEQDSLFGPDKVDLIVRKLQSAEWVEFGRRRKWPADHERDRLFVEQLMAKEPDKDLIAEVDAWVQWMVNKHDGRKGVKPRERFSNWVCYNSRFGTGASQQRRRVSSSGGGRGPRAGGAPAPRSAWADSGVSSL